MEMVAMCLYMLVMATLVGGQLLSIQEAVKAEAERRVL
jgi:hypothetical protein